MHHGIDSPHKQVPIGPIELLHRAQNSDGYRQIEPAPSVHLPGRVVDTHLDFDQVSVYAEDGDKPSDHRPVDLTRLTTRCGLICCITIEISFSRLRPALDRAQPSFRAKQSEERARGPDRSDAGVGLVGWSRVPNQAR
jgi:hypothetical protein